MIARFTLERLATPLVLTLSVAAFAMPIVWPLTSLGTSSHDAIDTHLFLWGFWWTREALGALENPYWTDLLLYPNGTSLAFSSFPLPYNVLSLPLQAIVQGIAGRVVAFNLIVLLSFVLSAVAAYALSLRLTGNRPAALVAGLIFACLPYRSLNVARLHVLGTEFPAFFVLALIWYTDTPSYRKAAAVGVAFAAALYSSPEYALFSAFFAAAWKVFHWRRWREFFSQRFVTTGAVAILTAGILAAPLVSQQLRALADGMVAPARALDEATLWSPALVSFVTPSRQHPVYGRLFAFAGEYEDPGIRGMRSETTIPLTAGVLALVGFLRVRRDSTTFWAVTCLFFFVLCLGPYLRLTGAATTSIPLPYMALYHLVWPLRIARDPTRLLPLAMLLLSVIAAFGVRACLQRVTTRRGVAGLTAVLATLVVFESLTRQPEKIAATDLIPAAYHRLEDPAPGGAVIDLTGDHQAMLAQTLHGRPITAGRYANPRSAAAEKMLYVESDFRDPRQLLGLGDDERARYVAADRKMLEAQSIRFIVAPADAPWVQTFAGMLGLSLVESGDLVIYERPQ